MDRLIQNRESITLIWYNPNLKELERDIIKIFNFRRMNDYILLYTQKLLFVEYLTSKKNEHIVVVLYEIEILDMVCKCEQVNTIFIVNSNNKNMIEYNHQYYPKMVAVFQDSDSMMVKLEEVIKNIEYQVAQQIDGMFTTLDQKEIALRDLQHTLGSSLWCQGFKCE